MASLEIMTKFNSACVFETVLHMAFIEIGVWQIEFFMSKGVIYTFYTCVCVGILGSNYIRSVRKLSISILKQL